MGIPRKQKVSPAEGEFLFEFDPEPLEEAITAYAGIPLLVRAMRSLDVPGSVQRHLQVKQRQRGFDEASYVESFMVLNALGADCLDDFDRLREDAGLAEMLGHELPSPEAARKFLYQFHDEEKIEQAQKELAVGQLSSIAQESPTASFDAGQPGDAAGDRTALCRAEDRHHRSGCDDHRKLEAPGAADPSRHQRISADIGVVGRDGFGWPMSSGTATCRRR